MPIADAFDEASDETSDETGVPGTRAIVIVHRGRIVAEEYADGYSADRKFLSQSMAKSVVNVLTGILVKQSKLSIGQPAPVPEWQGNDDPRGHHYIGKFTADEQWACIHRIIFQPIDV
ncbi:MAG: hypothetical protein E2O92_11150 [Alphaproteobacteria bacterium]|nr:MAG: hypothetical protein E2O92_11150 [Alphaproteobacteria bacterium]